MLNASDMVRCVVDGAIASFFRALVLEHPELQRYRIVTATTYDIDERTAVTTIDVLDGYDTPLKTRVTLFANTEIFDLTATLAHLADILFTFHEAKHD